MSGYVIYLNFPRQRRAKERKWVRGPGSVLCFSHAPISVRQAGIQHLAGAGIIIHKQYVFFHF